MSASPVEAKMLTRLERLAEPHGARVALKAPGHFHIQGALLVNYYPFSAKRTAYVDGTTKGSTHVEPESAIAMAIKLPALVEVFKRKAYRKVKLKLLSKHPFCHWCRCALADETATVDHVIALSRGGIDNANNRVLACQPCNSKRGNGMPELGLPP